jgi:N-methylhydantoinase B
MKTDSIELEVFGKIFGALAEQMGFTIVRTAHTTFVRETQDFGVALATTDGWFFAYPRTLGASTLLGLPFADCIRAIDRYEPGDVIFTNDPFSSKAGCTHVPDLTVFAPVFVGDELLCFTWGFIHSSDIGGAVPGSIAPSLSDTFQEGIRLPPTKLYRRGEVNEDVRRILQTNVRIPQQMWGDIQALRAGFHVANRKLQELARRYGTKKLRTVMDDLLLYSESKARRVFEQIPAGRYEFADYLEDDTVSDVPIRINLAMTVDKGTIHLDYTGTDPQVASAYNIPTAGKIHPWVIVGLGYFVASQDPDTPTNAGFFRALSVTLPEGSLVNPIFPAAIGLRSVTGVRILDVLMGALGQAIPDKVPVAGSGLATIVLLSVPDYERGGRRINVINPCVGGSGGRPMDDGFDGSDYTLGFMRNTPAEILEAETFILIHEFAYVPDSSGPGKYRGGLGVSLEFQVFAPDATLIARGMERTRFDPWGGHGGLPGARMVPALVNPGTPRERSIRKIDLLRLEPGDVVRIRTSGGGGYGDPLDRDPERVWGDVEQGFVSRGAAERVYGVVLDGDAGVDLTETARRRAQLRQTKRPTEDFPYSLGESRRQYERIWTKEARAALLEVLDRLPVLMRYRVKNEIHAALTPNGRTSAISPEEVMGAWGNLRSRLYPERYLSKSFVAKLTPGR